MVRPTTISVASAVSSESVMEPPPDRCFETHRSSGYAPGIPGEDASPHVAQ